MKIRTAMTSRQKKRLWQIAYGICSLLYIVWVVHLSRYNFDMVHRHYRLAGERLQTKRIEAIAREELESKCRKEARRVGLAAYTEDHCRSWPETVLAARQKKVENRLLAEKSLAWRKLVLFYLSFGVIFLLLPPLGVGLMISLFVRILKNLKLLS